MSDPYVYDRSNVLKNILDIKNQESLDEYENTIVNLQLIRVLKSNFPLKSSSDIFTIHKMLFEEVYDWAGTPRCINIEKQEVVLNGLSVPYSNHDEIMKDLKSIDKEYFHKKWGSMSHTTLIYNVSRYISSIWKTHPFREGNTRTITTYLYLLLKQNGHSIDTEILSKYSKYFRNALVLASIDEYSEYEYIESILSDAIRSKERNLKGDTIDDSKYSKIKDVELNNYKYNYHQLKEK